MVELKALLSQMEVWRSWCLAAVARDGCGSFDGGLSKCVHQPCSPLAAELLAIREGLRLGLVNKKWKKGFLDQRNVQLNFAKKDEPTSVLSKFNHFILPYLFILIFVKDYGICCENFLNDELCCDWLSCCIGSYLNVLGCSF